MLPTLLLFLTVNLELLCCGFCYSATVVQFDHGCLPQAVLVLVYFGPLLSVFFLMVVLLVFDFGTGRIFLVQVFSWLQFCCICSLKLS